MKTLGIFEAKTKLSEICEEVATSGEPTEISRRGKPLVRIIPLPKENESGSSIWNRVEAWEAANIEIDSDFERPPRESTTRDPLADYWEEA